MEIDIQSLGLVIAGVGMGIWGFLFLIAHQIFQLRKELKDKTGDTDFL